MKGNLQQALKLFEECEKIDAGNAPVQYEMGTIYKLLGSDDQALARAKFCAGADVKNEYYQLLLIDCLITDKQYTQAIKVRETLIKNFPAKSEFKEDLAIEYAIMGHYDKSFKIYDELEHTYGISEQLTLNKIKLLKSQKKNAEVEAELIRLSASDKGEVRYYAYLAEFYVDQHDLEKAKIMYDKILELDPNEPTVNLALHDYYSAKGMDQEAFVHLKMAFQNPDLDVSTKANIVGAYFQHAESKNEVALQRGLELTQIMLEVHPNATESNALYGDFLRLQNKLSEASVYFYRAAINEHRDARVWDNLLFVDNELSRYDSLEHHSKVAIELFPSQPVYYLYNGVANNQLKDYSKATRSLKAGIDFVIDNKTLVIQFLSALGDAYNSMKDYPNSDKAFEDALKIDSDNTYVLNNYAYYLSLRADNLTRAEKLSKRTIELQPNNRNYMDTYGWILYQQKKYGEAEVWLGSASKKGEKNPTILEHYGDALFKLGKQNEAMDQWEAAKLAGGNSEALLKKIKEKKLNDE